MQQAASLNCSGRLVIGIDDAPAEMCNGSCFVVIGQGVVKVEALPQGATALLGARASIFVGWALKNDTKRDSP